MKMRYLNLLVSVIASTLTFCTHKNLQTKSDCITDSDIESHKQNVTDLVQRLTDDSKNPEWKLIERSCNKVFFTASSANVIIYKYTHNKEISTKVSTGEMSSRSNPECLTKALEVVKSLKLTFTDSIIEKSKLSFGEMWADADVGGGSYLSCSDTLSSNFYTSLNLFIHEINHSVSQTSKDQHCSFFPWEDRTDCIDKKEIFPALEYLKSDRTIFGKMKVNKEIIQSLESTQKLYTENMLTAKTPILLIDELRSYAVGTEVLDKIYSHYGRSKIYLPNKKRTSIFPHLAIHELALHVNALNQKHHLKTSTYDRLFCESLKKSENNIKHWFQTLDNASDKANVTKAEKSVYEYIRKLYPKTSC